MRDYYPIAAALMGFISGAFTVPQKCECPPPAKAEFYGATIIDADHIERTWIYRDTVEYSKPNINLNLK